MVVFGLFHGLVFLPVILSLWGSDPYESAGNDDTRQIELRDMREKKQCDDGEQSKKLMETRTERATEEKV